MAYDEVVSNIITSVHGKDKVLDVRDNIRPGANYTDLFTGGIPVYLCDYSRGKGQNSVTVHAQLDSSMFDIFMNIANKNMVIEYEEDGTSAILLQAINAIRLGLIAFSKAYLQIYADRIKGTLSDPVEIMKRKGSAWVSLRDRVKENPAAVELPKGKKTYNYSYQQDRVNTYKVLDGGYHPVSSLQINRNGYYKGAVSKYPWYVKIVNFEALPVKNGDTTAYDAKSIRNKTEAFINVSDADMFKLSRHVTRFVDMWCCSNSTQAIRQAAQAKYSKAA